MALVVFLRGINVGGHRSFRPSLLAGRLRSYDVVNVGAAGTFVVGKPGSRAAFLSALRRRLPFDAVVAVCDGRDLLRLESEHPFSTASIAPGVIRFVSVLARAARSQPSLPFTIPSDDDWVVRVLAAKDRFIFGEYRRQMKTISCLGQIDKVFGAPATTRNWNTILSVVRILKEKGSASGGARSSRL
jgi:uncharacterized protein (DUF1697 family)